MFEEQYRKYYKDITPSDALNDETLALMKEARDHRATEPKKTLRWRPAIVLPIAGTAVAAMVTLVIVGAWTRGNSYNDVMGDFEDSFSSVTGNSMAGESESTEEPSDSESSAGPDENFQDSVEEDLPGDTADGNADTEYKSEDQAQDEGSDDAVADEDAPPSTDDESTDANMSTGDNSSSGSTAAPADPYRPEIIEDGTTETYLSIREFLNALSKKETTGYGKNYYNARELIIVPNLLPDGARFRHLHLNTENGKYSYSYLFTKEGKDYIIDIEVGAKTPKTLNDLRLQKEAVVGEEILTGKKEDHLYFLFGGRDEVTVTLTDTKATATLTEEEVAVLLAQFGLERCSLVNTIVDMKY